MARTFTVGPTSTYASIATAYADAKTLYTSPDTDGQEWIFEGEDFEDTLTSALAIDASSNTFGQTFRAASGAEHTGDLDAGYRIKGNFVDHLLQVSARSVTLQNLSVENLRSTTRSESVSVTNSFFTAERCSFKSNTTSGSETSAINVFFTGTGSDAVLRNSVFIGGTRAISMSGDNAVIQNCTVIGGLSQGVKTTAGADNLTFENVVAYGSSATSWAVDAGSTLTSALNNAGDTGTIPGTGSVTLVADPFAGPDDYSINAGSALEDAGADLSGTFTDSINGETRTVPFDIGAFAAVGGGGSTAVPFGHHLISRQFATIAASRLGGVLQ